MNDAELVAHLRSRCDPRIVVPDTRAGQAADRIEELNRELKRAAANDVATAELMAEAQADALRDAASMIAGMLRKAADELSPRIALFNSDGTPRAVAELRTEFEERQAKNREREVRRNG